MDQISGMRGYSPSGRWRKSSLDRRGKLALTAMDHDQQAEALLQAHRDTDALRRFGERLRKKKGINRETRAEFELEQETGRIFLKLYDSETGELQVQLTPEEVAEGLKSLEESDDDSTLSSFFVDLKV